MRRVGLSWWRDGLGGGEVLPPLPARDEEPEEEDGVEGLTHHFSRVFNRPVVSGRAPAAHHDPPLAATRRAAEFQYRGPDLTRTLPPDLKARLLRCSHAHAPQNGAARRDDAQPPRWAACGAPPDAPTAPHAPRIGAPGHLLPRAAFLRRTRLHVPRVARALRRRRRVVARQALRAAGALARRRPAQRRRHPHLLPRGRHGRNRLGAALHQGAVNRVQALRRRVHVFGGGELPRPHLRRRRGRARCARRGAWVQRAGAGRALRA
jgi:hypothetical protein